MGFCLYWQISELLKEQVTIEQVFCRLKFGTAKQKLPVVSQYNEMIIISVIIFTYCFSIFLGMQVVTVLNNFFAFSHPCQPEAENKSKVGLQRHQRTFRTKLTGSRNGDDVFLDCVEKATGWLAQENVAHVLTIREALGI